MPYLFILPAAALAVVAVVVFQRMRRMTASAPLKTSAVVVMPPLKSGLDRDCSESLSGAIRFPTVSGSDAGGQQFRLLYDYLAARYPNLHRVAKHNTVSGSSLLYRWGGSNPALKPLLLCAHLDVVPASGNWEHEPFSGDIQDGRIYGRGAIDCKHVVIGLMEAAERLIRSGYKPERDIFFAFGHDEETGGTNGAGVIAKYFQNYKIEFEAVLDEGPFLMPRSPWCNQAAAFVGVTEKGYLNIRLTARASGGHSSVPGPHTAVGTLSEAICRVTAARFPRRILPVMREFFDRAYPCFSKQMQLFYSNMWLFGPLFLKRLASDPMKNAYLCTTAAPTVLSGGQAYNVLPDRAEAVINFRPLHGDSCSDIVAFIRTILRGLDVEIEVLRANDPSEVSDYTSPAFRILEDSIRDTFGNILVSPNISTAASDARKYELICKNVFRFCPFPINETELSAMHGDNENLPAESLAAGVVFYMNYIKTAGKETQPD